MQNNRFADRKSKIDFSQFRVDPEQEARLLQKQKDSQFWGNMANAGLTAAGGIAGGVAGTFLAPGVGTAAGAGLGASLGSVAGNMASQGINKGADDAMTKEQLRQQRMASLMDAIGALR